MSNYGHENLYDATERFWHYVDKRSDDECWEWTAGCTPNGYGRYTIHHNERTVSAHKYSWEIHNGNVPDGLVVRHSCDNKKCVNPNHLCLGTQEDNVHDRDERHHTARWESHWKAKLNQEKVEKIRKLYSTGKYSQSQLADRFGVTQTTISRVILKETWTVPKYIKEAKAIERIVGNSGIVER